MKKILTILLAVASVSALQAQSSSHPTNNLREHHQHERDVAYGSRHRNGNNRDDDWYDCDRYAFGVRERDAQIRNIHEEYSFRIASVKRTRDLKKRAINEQVRLLEQQRDERIQQVQLRYAAAQNKPQNRNAHSGN